MKFAWILALPLLGCASSKPAPSAAPSASSAPAPAGPVLTGTWRSECEPRGGTSNIQEWKFDGTTWSLDYVTYVGETCSDRFVTIHEEGTFQVGAPSKAAPDAWELRFDVAKKTMTPHGTAAVQVLAGPEGCSIGGFVAGVAMDMSKSDCTGLGQPSLERCKSEYDLVQLSSDGLRLGARGADACAPERRPKSLLARPLAKKA